MNNNFKIFYGILLGLVVMSCKSGKDDFDATGVFETTETIVSSESTGKILSLEIEEGAVLTANQLVGSVDCENLGLQKAQVEASVEAVGMKQNNAGPQTQILKEQLNTQYAQIATQKEQLKVIEREKVRLQNLVKAEAIPTKQLDDVNGQVEILKKQILAMESQTGVLKQQIRSQEEQVGIQNRGILGEKKPLMERIAQIEDQIKRCSIINPTAGVVLVKYAETNEITGMGKPLYKLGDMQNMVLRAYISGDQLAKFKTNQKVKVFVDKGKDEYKELEGVVEWIATKAEFTPKTIQTKDERANLVYATKIRVKNDGFLKIGMYGEIKLQ
ncbi:HlyD family efflux transporter periplasmic adaptor subunit [Lacihabitans sp. LS3-19]|nr:HlyD family efflux transporter periplasmic adaptor subunit [Lacihabitans sp. LS3-19]